MSKIEMLLEQIQTLVCPLCRHAEESQEPGGWEGAKHLLGVAKDHWCPRCLKVLDDSALRNRNYKRRVQRYVERTDKEAERNSLLKKIRRKEEALRDIDLSEDDEQGGHLPQRLHHRNTERLRNELAELKNKLKTLG